MRTFLKLSILTKSSVSDRGTDDLSHAFAGPVRARTQPGSLSNIVPPTGDGATDCLPSNDVLMIFVATTEFGLSMEPGQAKT
jgi:hypothetical protein